MLTKYQCTFLAISVYILKTVSEVNILRTESSYVSSLLKISKNRASDLSFIPLNARYGVFASGLTFAYKKIIALGLAVKFRLNFSLE